MLAEWLTSLRISCPPPVRRLGYPKELAAITHRHRRRRDAWRPHLENSKAAVLEAADACPQRNRALVLGAGALLDVPLEELCRRFDEVVLADIAFLPATRRTARRFGNSRLMACDLTGTVAALTRVNCLDVLPQPKAPAELSAFVPDLTLSLNLLSQLPILPKRFLEPTFPSGGEPPDPRIGAFCRSLVAHHLAWLAARPGKRCLISDAARTYYRAAGGGHETAIKEDPLFGVPLPEGGNQWDWDVAPPGELPGGIGLQNRVRSVMDFGNEERPLTTRRAFRSNDPSLNIPS